MAIIDFSHPNLIGKEWRVRVVKTTPKGDLFPQNVRFEDKNDAFAFHKHIRQIWLNQRER